METLTKRHESVSEETATKLRQVVAAMTPKELYMGDFGLLTECGTTYCLAGKAVAMFAPHNLRWEGRRLEPDFTEAEAIRILGLAEPSDYDVSALSQAERLFYLPNWPDEFGDRYDDSYDAIQHLSILHDRVEHYIATAK